uniref:Orf8 protein n=1 Tax=Mouse coronavirus TaxID=2913384 RepID=A0AA49XCE6_9NIDO|nr:orf8 protein [Mouse coronavirus]
MKLMPKIFLFFLYFCAVLGAPTVTYSRRAFLGEPETYEELLADYKFLGDFVTPGAILGLLRTYTEQHEELQPWDFDDRDDDKLRLLALLKCKDLMEFANGAVPKICKLL